MTNNKREMKKVEEIERMGDSFIPEDQMDEDIPEEFLIYDLYGYVIDNRFPGWRQDV